MLSDAWLARLDDDPDRVAALRYLASKAERYPPHLYIPPWQRTENEDRDRPFAALHIHATYDDDRRQHRIDTMEFCDGETREVCYSSDIEDQLEFFLRYPIHHRYASYLIVTDGGDAGILNAWLETLGPSLIERGYTIEPCLSNGGLTWAIIRKGKRRWLLTTSDTMTGLELPSLLAFAEDAEPSAAGRSTPAWLLFTACAAYSLFLRESFGSALRPTVSMIASASARRCMPENALKWRPSPLLVALERDGIGYRGGVTYSREYRGPTHRIDVNRQYTSMLERPLPLSAMFGRYKGPSSGQEGVFACTVHAPRDEQYPIGIWQGEDRGFERTNVKHGSFVSVLHTSEFEALQALGCDIDVGYGFAWKETFDLSEYVEKIRAVIATYGRTSPQGMATKPLGNMLYGKFGQGATRWELCYAPERPDETWRPYSDSEDRDVPFVWERQHTRHSMGMHVEIAATITGYARSQTMTTVAMLDAMGLRPVRAHTDSITTVGDPRPVIPCDDEEIGAWKYERYDDDALIQRANAYADGTGAHVAGFSNVTRAMLDEMHAGGEVVVAREINLPREGWYRRRGSVTYRLTG